MGCRKNSRAEITCFQYGMEGQIKRDSFKNQDSKNTEGARGKIPTTTTGYIRRLRHKRHKAMVSIRWNIMKVI